MTTTVYFDLDNTLLEYTTPFGEIFANTLPVDATEGMRRTYSESVLEASTEQMNTPYERAFEAVREEYDLGLSPKTLATRYIENEVEATRVTPSVRRLVESVAAVHRTRFSRTGTDGCNAANSMCTN